MSDSEDGAGVPLMEPGFSRSPSPETSGKRKRENDSKQSKRAKKRKSKKPKNVDDEDLNQELGLNLAIGRMDNSLLADYMAQRTKRFEPDLSMVELEDRHVPGMLYLFTAPHYYLRAALLRPYLMLDCSCMTSRNFANTTPQRKQSWTPAAGSSKEIWNTSPTFWSISPSAI